MDINTETLDLIHEEVLISDKDVVGYDDEVPFELFWDAFAGQDTGETPVLKQGRFVATKLDPANRFPDAPDTLTYILTKSPDELSEDEREEVLNYRLSSFDETEEVTLADLFLHGEFIEQVSYFKNGVQYSV